MLCLMAAGLTLGCGIMNLVNLAHGSFYMVGAYLATTFFSWTGSFVAAVVLSLLTTLAVGVLVELIALRTLYERDHLDQVLATFGLILFFNELIAILWGRAAIYTATPAAFAGYIELAPRLRYPTYRAAVILVGLGVAALLYVVVTRTRLGMLIRAGASNRTMVAALGVNIRLLYTVVFGFGALLPAAGAVPGARLAHAPPLADDRHGGGRPRPRPRAAGGGRTQPAFLHRPLPADDDLRARRAQPGPRPGLRRHGELRSRGLPRDRRLCRRHPRLLRRRQRVPPVVGGDRGVGGGGARHRCDLDPDQRRLLHHDHARLRADALLSRDQPRDLRRRQRDAAPDAQPVRRSHRPQEPVRVLLPRPGAARALPGPGPPARQRALRHGHPGREVQRAARAGDRLLALPLQARRLRPCRGRVRPRRRAARAPDRVPHPPVHALDPVRRDHVHGDSRRDGHAVRARGRRDRAPRARGRALRPARALANHPGAR